MYLRDSTAERWKLPGATLVAGLVLLPMLLAMARFDGAGSAPWQLASMRARAAFLPGGTLGIWVIAAICSASLTFVFAGIVWKVDGRKPYARNDEAKQNSTSGEPAFRSLTMLRVLLLVRGLATAVATFCMVLLYVDLAWDGLIALEGFQLPGLRWTR